MGEGHPHAVEKEERRVWGGLAMKLYSGYIVVVVYVHLMEFGMWEVVFYYMCGYVE